MWCVAVNCDESIIVSLMYSLLTNCLSMNIHSETSWVADWCFLETYCCVRSGVSQKSSLVCNMRRAVKASCLVHTADTVNTAPECIVRVGGVNRIGDKSRLSATETSETVLSSLELWCEQSSVLQFVLPVSSSHSQAGLYKTV